MRTSYTPRPGQEVAFIRDRIGRVSAGYSCLDEEGGFWVLADVTDAVAKLDDARRRETERANRAEAALHDLRLKLAAIT